MCESDLLREMLKQYHKGLFKMGGLLVGDGLADLLGSDIVLKVDSEPLHP